MGLILRGIFTIPPDVNFACSLARGLWDSVGHDPLKLSEMLVLLPTRRACRHVRDAFAILDDKGGNVATLLPRLQPLGDVDEDELGFVDGDFGEDDVTLPPALSPLRRQMMLTQLVQKKDPSVSLDQAALLAEALGRLLDEAAINDRDLRELVGLVQDKELALHWQETVTFLDIITQQWPKVLDEYNALDAASRRAMLLRAQAEAWRKNSPLMPIIVAGSTGSVPATAELIATVATLPQGSVVLPGLDQVMDTDAWNVLDETHPQHNLRNLLRVMKTPRDKVALWPSVSASPPSTRVRLMSVAQLPASVTDMWRSLKAVDFPRDDLVGLSRLDLENPEEEAAVIALKMRSVLEEPQKTATLITPDRGLAERVTAALGRWGIVADDSAGTFLANSPAGSMLSHILEAARPHATDVDMLTLLKHPLAAAGLDAAECRRRARAMEIALWRTHDDRIADDATTQEKIWLHTFEELLQSLRRVWEQKLPLVEWIELHRHVTENFVTRPNDAGAVRLWRGAAGEKIAAWLDEWRNAGDTLGAMSGEDYAALFQHLVRRASFRPTYGQHPRLSILGPLEARLIHADVLILGGLNEGVWPGEAAVDPWMSRPMKRDFGLPLPEQRVGLAAHDFAQLANAPVVMMTRARRSGTAPTVPSRFLLQLETVLTGLGYLERDTGIDVLQPAEPWAAWARMLDAPTGDLTPIAPPAPRPPVGARPTQLSVTRVGIWLRNPYEIYARYILRLKKLDMLEKDVDAAERGTMLHAALEDFIRIYPAQLPPDAYDQLISIGKQHFAARDDHPQVQAIWWPRFKKLAAWFVDIEKGRRTVGTLPLGVEAEGSTMIDAFKLSDRADRIDRLAYGDLALIDYKSGFAPSKKQVEMGLEPQLPLLALIASRGGFAGDKIAAQATGEIAYWKIGGKAGGDAKTLDVDIAKLVVEAEQGLTALIAAYDDAAMPYLVSPRPGLAPRYDDYAHLARRAEWGHLTGGDE